MKNFFHPTKNIFSFVRQMISFENEKNSVSSEEPFSLLPEAGARAACQAPLAEQGRGWAWQSRIPESGVPRRLVLLALKEQKKYEKIKGFNCLSPILFWGPFISSDSEKEKINLHII